MNRRTTPTVVLGFDALAAEYLDEFDLPNFDSLRERGVAGPLESTFPPWTGSAWPSMYTGVDPSQHGVYSFFDFGAEYPDTADIITRDDVDAPAIWNYLSAEGRSSVVLNVPVTHPAEQLDGVLVPGYLAPESVDGYPRGIREDIGAALGEDYRIYATNETGDPDEETLRSYLDLIDLRRRTAAWLLETQDPDLAFLQVQKTDTVFHQFDERDAFRRVYEAADAFVGTVLEAVPDANVIVCSDHGIGPTPGYNVYVNEILRAADLVEATRDGETPTLGETKHELAGDESAEASSAIASRAVSSVATALSGLGIEPGDVYAAARRVGADGALRRLLPDAAAGSIASHVDWADSAAYCRSGPELGVRINLEGREPAGVVPPDEYDAVREAVIETLADVRTPDGEPAFEWVRRREAVYDGPRAEDACDVLFRPAGMNHVVATNLLGKQFVSIDKYNHKTEGVFIGAGPGIDASGQADGLSLTDVAPMVMALTGCAVPERMTGSARPDLLDAAVERRSFGEVEFGAGSGTGEARGDDGVEARLEDLGYL